MDKDGHLFGSDMEEGKDALEYKTSETELLLDLKVLMKEYYLATFEDDGKHLKLCFKNGQKFRISVEEIK